MSRFITQDAGVIDQVKRYRSAASMLSFSKEEQEEARQNIVAYMNDEGVEAMQAGNNYVTITRYTSVRFDTCRFRREHPELAHDYTVETEALRFTVKDA